MSNDNRPLALSVEKVRHEMLRGILIPRELVNAALQTTAAKLHARETKFFTFKGRVTQRMDVDDHSIQLQAADQIYSLAGLYSRERESRVSTPGVALEIDPVSGVIRLVVGSPSLSLDEAPRHMEVPDSPDNDFVGAPSLTEPSPAEASVARRGIPDSVWKIISDEEV